MAMRIGMVRRYLGMGVRFLGFSFQFSVLRASGVRVRSRRSSPGGKELWDEP